MDYLASMAILEQIQEDKVALTWIIHFLLVKHSPWMACCTPAP